MSDDTKGNGLARDEAASRSVPPEQRRIGGTRQPDSTTKPAVSDPFRAWFKIGGTPVKPTFWKGRRHGRN